MKVRALFTVTEVTQRDWNPNGRAIKLSARYDDNTPIERRYAQATPSGTIEMYVDNPPATEALALGRKFWVDFTPVDEEQQA